MQTNAEIIRQANARVVESWGELAKEVLQRVEIMREEVTRVTEMGMRQSKNLFSEQVRTDVFKARDLAIDNKF